MRDIKMQTKASVEQLFAICLNESIRTEIRYYWQEAASMKVLGKPLLDNRQVTISSYEKAKYIAGKSSPLMSWKWNSVPSLSTIMQIVW